MIDLNNEQILTIAEAATWLSERRYARGPRRGKIGPKIAASTVWRWSRRAQNPLEPIKIGEINYTSIDALQRAAERGAEGAGAKVTQPRHTRSAAKRQRDSERAEAELIRRGG
jgi:hypothetical protein